MLNPIGRPRTEKTKTKESGFVGGKGSEGEEEAEEERRQPKGKSKWGTRFRYCHKMGRFFRSKSYFKTNPELLIACIKWA